MAIAEVSVVPVGTKTASLSTYVAGVLKALENEGAKYQLTPMGTIVEGDMEEILRLVGKIHGAAFGEGVERVVTAIKIDDRRDKPLTSEGKIRSAQEKLARL